jgi:hypothetical protein
MATSRFADLSEDEKEEILNETKIMYKLVAISQ